MSREVDSIKVGDRMRFSVELIKQINEMPDRCSVLVEVISISEFEGEKTVLVSTVRPDSHLGAIES